MSAAEKRSGPRVTVKLSCFDCTAVRSESYACQGDSGFNVTCSATGKTIGDTTWETPGWCPLVTEEHAEEAARKVREKFDGWRR